MPHSDEVRAQALALYIEHDSSRRAAEAMGALGVSVHPVTIQRWSAETDGHASAMQRERRHTLGERWYGVAMGLLDRVEDAVETLPHTSVVVPAAIASDKAKLFWDEPVVPVQAQPFAIVVIQNQSAPGTGSDEDEPPIQGDVIEGESRDVDEDE